jgi:ATP-dependent exoDNAse (exonuclease V) beta subunit
MKWSYSALRKFITCPRQYNEVKIKQTYIEPETEVMSYGREVHKALEELITLNKPLPENYKKFNYLMAFISTMPGIKYAELQLAVDHSKTSCDFNSPDYWVRGICDLFIADGAEGYLLDYKTGSDKYADTRQLKLMAALAFHRFPEIYNIKAGLLFVTREKFIDEEYSREDLNNLWSIFDNDLRRLEHSFKEDWWPTNPSGLCLKHCPVLSCEFNGRN